MRHFFTTERIKGVLRQAERLGINAFIGRADNHITRVMMEYWDEGGTIQWIAQSCPEYRTVDGSIERALRGGAKACFIHGGEMDKRFASGDYDEVITTIRKIRESGIPVGVAGHNPGVFEWTDKHCEVDFYMCCYYNPSSRKKKAEHEPGKVERFHSDDREAMVKRIRLLKKPVFHYKVLAAGRNDPREAFVFVGDHIRPQDAVCVGIYPGRKSGMLEETVGLFKKYSLKLK